MPGCLDCIRTDLVELNDVGLCAQLAEQALAGLAVWAIGLGEDSYNDLVSRLLSWAFRTALAYQRHCCR